MYYPSYMQPQKVAFCFTEHTKLQNNRKPYYKMAKKCTFVNKARKQDTNRD